MTDDDLRDVVQRVMRTAAHVCDVRAEKMTGTNARAKERKYEAMRCGSSIRAMVERVQDAEIALRNVRRRP